MEQIKPITHLQPKGVANSKLLPKYVLDDDFEQRLSENALFTLKIKYLKRDADGKMVETPKEAIYRMARTMADVERQYGKSEAEINQITEEFYKIISNIEFCPAGRIWTNAGTDIRGLFNCYVLPIGDSLEQIYDSVKWAAIVHKNGGGTGYNFSSLRPRGTYVKKSKGIASGTVSFIKQFDRETEIINSGNRRGANMGIVNVDHPDILDFIYAKTERKEITNFNISVGVTKRFMEAALRNEYYDLMFAGKPFDAKELENIRENIEKNKAGGAEVDEKPRPPSLVVDANGVDVINTYKGEIIGRVYDGRVQLHAGKVIDVIAELAWRTADPGMIFLDAINNDNPLPRKGPIMATNPCGEQPLHPFDACNLGSLNLAIMVKEENGKTVVDYDRIGKVVKTIVRFMDNVNDANEGPLPQIEETVKRHRRIGLGVMGWADMLAKLGVPYDSDEAYQLAEEVMGTVTDEAKRASHELAIEKSPFAEFDSSIYNDGNEENVVRNVQRTTIAPTGTISMLFDVSSGIEPFFALAYVKKIRGGDNLAYANAMLEDAAKKAGVYCDEFLELTRLSGSLFWNDRLEQMKTQRDYMEASQNKSKQELQSLEGLKSTIKRIEELLMVFPESRVPEPLKKAFKTSYDIGPEDHVRMQAAFQKHTDNAVSKTINMPFTASVEDVKNAYLSAYKLGLKGITVYRDGSKSVQVLNAGVAGPAEEVKAKKINKPEVLEVKNSSYYAIKTGEGKLHITISHDERGYPDQVFLNLGPVGSSRSTSASVEGITISRYMKDVPEPDLLQIVKDMGNAKSDKPIGFGPNRIDSIEHALSIALKHHLMAYGIVVQDSNGFLKQVVFKNQSSKPVVAVHKEDLSSQTLTCSTCGSHNVAMVSGCREPMCFDCGQSKCE